VIGSATVREVCRLAGVPEDVRRFRPNIVVRTLADQAFEEDEWVGAILAFGESDRAPTVAVTMPDVRCAMVNIDPDRGTTGPEMLKAVVRANDNNAGIYGAVTLGGPVVVGQTVFLRR
jgi:uncharacterized protein YcbX